MFEEQAYEIDADRFYLYKIHIYEKVSKCFILPHILFELLTTNSAHPISPLSRFSRRLRIHKGSKSLVRSYLSLIIATLSLTMEEALAVYEQYYTIHGRGTIIHSG